MKYRLPMDALQYHCSQRSPAMQHCRPYSTAHDSLLLFLSRLFRCLRLISSFELSCSSSLRSMSTTSLILSATRACSAANVCSCACRSSNLCIFVCRCHIRSSCATSDRSAMNSTGLDSDGIASCRALNVTAGIPSGEPRSGLGVLNSGRAGEGLITLCAAGTGP